MHRRMKWRLAMRIASLPKERWVKKSSRMESRTQQQNQNEQSCRKTKKRWEDEINEFLKSEETEATKGSGIKNNDTWIWAAEQRGSI